MRINLYKYNNIKKCILIRKSFKQRNNDIILPSLKLNVDNIEIDYSRFDEEMVEYIKKFESILRDNINCDNLIFFYNHINELIIEKVDSVIDDAAVNGIGKYSLKDNKIIYCDLDSLDHEFVHFASSISKDGVEYVGFFQKNCQGYWIGLGLNEGYAQIITERYFNGNDCLCYPLTNFFVSKLEGIVTREVMENLFFKADLLGLINYLEKYNTRNEILKFIKILDVVNGYEKIYGSDKVDKDIVKYYFKLAFREMSVFLFSTLMKKVMIEKDNKDVDCKYLNDLSNSFIEQLILSKLSFDSESYKLFGYMDFVKCNSKVKIRK